MIISGSIHYFDKQTQTLGDFLEYWWLIFLPLFNIIPLIIYPLAYIMEYLENSNWLQRIKDIKIKSVIIFFCSFLFFSCGESKCIKISKEEYSKLKGVNQSEYPKYFKLEISTLDYKESGIILGNDNHEYLVFYYGTDTGNVEHYVDCKLCAKRNKK
jgi:hypothetical protein